MHNRSRSGMFRRRSNGRGFRRQNNDNEGRGLISGAFSNARGKNNFKPHQSVEKLLERYKLLAKEALSSGDRTLSENYLQHVDHFERIISQKKSNQNGNNSQVGNINKEQNNNLSTDSTTNQGSITKNEE
tara:strand:+ start:254 stop:643 length:390 start_codon:yes stop_codon:yes gene_type:complete